MKVIKRNGKEVEFDINKIVRAIKAARDEVKSSIPDTVVISISDTVWGKCKDLGREVAVEEIQDLVEEVLMATDYRVARAYVRYRYDREKARSGNTTDTRILTLVENTNEDIKQENSNKNSTIIPTQRDYMAGEVSKDLSRRLLLPKDVVKAHDEGLIHFHDMDYFAQHSHNCDLVNLEDMLQNGTVISGTMIEKPHKFSTACNIATQIIAQVASSQYGGQSISIAHLVPFVEESRKALRKEVVDALEKANLNLTEEQIDILTEERVKKDVEKGVQTIQYQVVTLMTTNGQAPFITVYMYIDEVPESMRNDAVMVIKEILNQRIEGVKNEKGVYITPAFPKLIYVLDEDNIYEDSKYWDVTLLAAKCTAKRMVPDYISAKKMLEYKIDRNGEGHIYTCMGCLDGDTPVVMFDGSQKKARDIKVGDTLMGTNSEPRRVLELTHGYDNMYRVDQNRGESYIVNGRHILSLIWTNKRSNGKWNYGDVVNISVVDYLNLTKSERYYLKGYKSGYELDEKDLDIPPYLLGLWLGDGDRNASEILVNKEQPEIKKYIEDYVKLNALEVTVTEHKKSDKVERLHIKSIVKGSKGANKFLNGLKKYNLLGNKHIPEDYIRGTIKQRSELLAGLINTDGSVNDTRHQYYSSDYNLILSAKRIADSLGLTTKVLMTREEGDYKCCGEIKHCKAQYVLTIIGFDCDKLLASKRVRKNTRANNNLYTLTVSLIGLGEYFGVNIDGNQLYLLGDCTVTHNCRSFLTPYVDENGNPKYYGRFNQGVVSINLPFVALLAREKVDKSGVKFSNKEDYQARLEEVFWSILEDRLELCYRALMCRHKRLEGTLSDVAPILWQYGAISRLKKGEKIDKLLHGGYSTISLGYAGLYECTQAIRGCSHTAEYGKPFALEVMKKLNAKCAEWKAKENVDFSVYGTPLESATYKFAKALQKRFGIVKNVSDRSYVTNSYHVHVTEPIDAFSKLEFEAEFQRLSPGGAISYVEVPNLTNNIDAVLAVMKYIYQHIMYAELNTKSDYCQVCGYDGEIQIVEDGNKLVWECPNCHNRDQSKMNVARRTCGYIGSHFWNQGRTQEIRDRVLHL